MAYTTVDNPFKHFNTKIYTGDGNSSQSITGVGFQPDWVWIKNRGTTDDHVLHDAVRGAGERIKSNSHVAESTVTNQITAFTTDGFTSSNSTDTGASSNNYVAWNWKANGTGSSNSDGSISSTVSVNTTAGFSIVSYTGNGSQPSTVGHGLGVIPEVVLVKPRSIAYSWCMYHTSTGNTKLLYLDTNGAESGSSVWNNTSPTSSVFTVNDNQVNKSGETHIAYCFKEIKGYSKFGSYTGNGNADGTFIHTGFRPAMIIAKETSEARDWQIWDDKRLGYNASGGNKNLIPNDTAAEDTYADIDILSNGFKLRSTSSAHNKSSQTYMYMAFAGAPFVTEGTKAAGTAR